MHKQLVVAAVAAALLVSSFAEAKPSSGFSSKPSSSSSSTSSYKPSAPAPKPYSPPPAAAKPASRPDYSSFSSFSKKPDAPKPSAPSYAPQNKVTPTAAPTPQFKPSEPVRAAATVANPVIPPAVAAPAKSGFAAQAKSNTGKAVVGVAAATALGGAAYAATSNHDAVAAYEASQKAAESAKIADATRTESTGTRIASTDKRDYSTATAPSTSSTQARTASVSTSPQYYPQPQPQPQVIVVQEAPRYHRNVPDDDAYWYQRGRESAQRESITVPPSASQPHVVQPARVQAPIEKTSSISAFGVILSLIMVFALVWFVYYVCVSGNKPTAKASARKPNYTL